MRPGGVRHRVAHQRKAFTTALGVPPELDVLAANVVALEQIGTPALVIGRSSGPAAPAAARPARQTRPRDGLHTKGTR